MASDFIGVLSHTFRKVGAIRVSDTFYSDPSTATSRALPCRSSLLSSSGRSGLLVWSAPITQEGKQEIHIAQADALLRALIADRAAAEEEAVEKGLDRVKQVDLPISAEFAKQIPVQCLSDPICHLTFNSTGDFLCVASNMCILVYSTPSLWGGSGVPLVQLDMDQPVVDLVWTTRQDVLELGLLMEDKTFRVYDVNIDETKCQCTQAYTFEPVSAIAAVSCGWVMGFSDGRMAILNDQTLDYEPVMVPPHQPPEDIATADPSNGEPFGVHALQFLAPDTLLVGMYQFDPKKPNADREDPNKVSIAAYNITKNEWMDYGDVLRDEERCLEDASEKLFEGRHRLMAAHIEKLRLSVFASSKAAEVTIMGVDPDADPASLPPHSTWPLQWWLVGESESDQIVVAIDSEFRETYALGLVVDCTNTVSSKLPPEPNTETPAVFMLASNGRMHVYQLLTSNAAHLDLLKSDVMKPAEPIASLAAARARWNFHPLNPPPDQAQPPQSPASSLAPTASDSSDDEVASNQAAEPAISTPMRSTAPLAGKTIAPTPDIPPANAAKPVENAFAGFSFNAAPSSFTMDKPAVTATAAAPSTGGFGSTGGFSFAQPTAAPTSTAPTGGFGSTGGFSFAAPTAGSTSAAAATSTSSAAAPFSFGPTSTAAPSSTTAAAPTAAFAGFNFGAAEPAKKVTPAIVTPVAPAPVAAAAPSASPFGFGASFGAATFAPTAAAAPPAATVVSTPTMAPKNNNPVRSVSPVADLPMPPPPRSAKKNLSFATEPPTATDKNLFAPTATAAAPPAAAPTATAQPPAQQFMTRSILKPAATQPPTPAAPTQPPPAASPYAPSKFAVDYKDADVGDGQVTQFRGSSNPAIDTASLESSKGIGSITEKKFLETLIYVAGTFKQLHQLTRDSTEVVMAVQTANAVKQDEFSLKRLRTLTARTRVLVSTATQLDTQTNASLASLDELILASKQADKTAAECKSMLANHEDEEYISMMENMSLDVHSSRLQQSIDKSVSQLKQQIAALDAHLQELYMQYDPSTRLGVTSRLAVPTVKSVVGVLNTHGQTIVELENHIDDLQQQIEYLQLHAPTARIDKERRKRQQQLRDDRLQRATFSPARLTAGSALNTPLKEEEAKAAADEFPDSHPVTPLSARTPSKSVAPRSASMLTRSASSFRAASLTSLSTSFHDKLKTSSAARPNTANRPGLSREASIIAINRGKTKQRLDQLFSQVDQHDMSMPGEEEREEEASRRWARTGPPARAAQAAAISSMPAPAAAATPWENNHSSDEESIDSDDDKPLLRMNSTASPDVRAALPQPATIAKEKELALAPAAAPAANAFSTLSFGAAATTKPAAPAPAAAPLAFGGFGSTAATPAFDAAKTTTAGFAFGKPTTETKTASPEPAKEKEKKVVQPTAVTASTSAAGFGGFAFGSTTSSTASTTAPSFGFGGFGPSVPPSSDDSSKDGPSSAAAAILSSKPLLTKPTPVTSGFALPVAAATATATTPSKDGIAATAPAPAPTIAFGEAGKSTSPFTPVPAKTVASPSPAAAVTTPVPVKPITSPTPAAAATAPAVVATPPKPAISFAAAPITAAATAAAEPATVTAPTSPTPTAAATATSKDDTAAVANLLGGLATSAAKPAAAMPATATTLPPSTSLFGSSASTSSGFGSMGSFGSALGFGSSSSASATSTTAAASTSTPALGGGLFGSTSNLFGATASTLGSTAATTTTPAPATGGLFGATSGGLFGSTPATAATTAGTTAATTTNLFGTTSTSAASSTNLFGSTPATTGASTTSLFGSQPTNLFGSATPAATSNLFGSTPAPAAAALFGNSSNNSASAVPVSSGGLFGAPVGGLFGSTPTPAPAAAAPLANNLFGSSTPAAGAGAAGTAAATAAFGSLFGSSTSTPATGSNPFASTSSQPGSNPFGSSSTSGGVFGSGSGGGMFGSTAAFGAAPAATTNAFGGATTNAFGSAGATTNAFGGAPAGGSNPFGGAPTAAASASPFGGAPSGGAFAGSNPQGIGFGKSTFGSAPSTLGVAPQGVSSQVAQLAFGGIGGGIGGMGTFGSSAAPAFGSSGGAPAFGSSAGGGAVFGSSSGAGGAFGGSSGNTSGGFGSLGGGSAVFGGGASSGGSGFGSLGGSAAPAFGGAAFPAQPAFGATNTMAFGDYRG